MPQARRFQQRLKKKMGVVRHDDAEVKIVAPAVVVQVVSITCFIVGAAKFPQHPRKLGGADNEAGDRYHLYDHGRRYDLHFGVVMPDHTHLLLQPLLKSPGLWHSLSEIMKTVKGVSA